MKIRHITLSSITLLCHKHNPLKRTSFSNLQTNNLFLYAEAAVISSPSTSNNNVRRSISSSTVTTTSSNTTNYNPDDHAYEIIKSKTVYNRWRSIIQQKVKMPNDHVVDYDIVDQKGVGAVLIFAFNSKTKTATLIKEYNPGCHKLLCGPAAGIIENDPSKHDSDPVIAAQYELEEECHLTGGTWHRLVNDDTTGVAMDKYVKTEIVPYLVIDPIAVEGDPRPLDLEEDIEILEGISVPRILEMIYEGKMNLTGGWGCLLAIQKLRDLGEID